MDRTYIQSEHIVERYLSGELTVREAREFEKYCLDHPDYLNSLPIPVRLKARLARRPLEDSETGVFQAIPSSATHAVLAAAEDGLEEEEEREDARRGDGSGVNRILVVGLAAALLAALGGMVAYALRANSLAQQLGAAHRASTAAQMQAPGGVQAHRVKPVRARPEQATLALGRLDPPQLIDLHIDVSQTKHGQFFVTVDKEDGVRVLQLRRLARDSNRELRLGLNSSAFGPGDYLLKIDGYNWRGQTEAVGWVRISLH